MSLISLAAFFSPLNVKLVRSFISSFVSLFVSSFVGLFVSSLLCLFFCLKCYLFVHSFVFSWLVTNVVSRSVGTMADDLKPVNNVHLRSATELLDPVIAHVTTV